MQTILLREFIEPVPTCTETATIEDALVCLQHDLYDKVVMLDGAGAPVGVVTSRALLAYVLLSNEGQGAEAQSWNLQALQTPLNQCQKDHALIEPVTVLPLHWTLAEFFPYLDQVTNRHWSFVEPNGQYWGMLAQTRLLRYIATHIPLAAVSKEAIPSSLGWSPQLAIAQVAAEVSQSLVQLLEWVPVPMMLQTSQGRVISQNQAWRHHIGELINLPQVQQEASVFLEVVASSPEGSLMSAQNVRHPASPQTAFSMPVVETIMPLGDDATSQFCRSGVDEDSCVCICPMVDGQERIWQFVKVPILNVPPNLSQHPLDQTDNGADSSKPVRFQLAPLSPYGIDAPSGGLEAIAEESLWLIMAQDLTEQQQVTRELAAKNADLVQLNRLKDEFLACISHELKTPLTAILGLSSLLKDQHLGTLNPRQSRYAQLIHQSGRHLILIVNDILDLTRIETGQLDLQPDVLMIESICNRAYTQAKQALFSEETSETADSPPEQQRSSIPFTLEIQPGITTIIADEVRLRQMLSNLLSNAIKFTEPGGEIGLTVETWDGWIAFTVWDTGIGIPAEKQHLVFQKFQQLESPLTRQFEGTGLGLFLTQRLAHLHGGDLTFVSTEGKGSQFTLLLPPSPPGAETMQRSHYENESQFVTRLAQTVSTVNRLALVVESVPQMLQDLTSQLNRVGYRVAIARSGTEALEKIRCLQPSVVLLNPLLPMLSGWDVLTLLKADAQTKQIPIVLIGTWAEHHQAHTHGADEILTVPIQPDVLQRILNQVTRQRSQNTPPVSIPEPTVLHLHLGGSSLSAMTPSESTGQDTAALNLNQLLYPNHCRILEIDDLDQADLMAQVWQPDVILLEGQVPDPFIHLQQLSTYPSLAALPLITLTPEVTQAANLIPELAVYPYLALMQTHSSKASTGNSTLFQVIQVAAGMGWVPNILMVDVVMASQPSETPSESSQTMGYRLHHCLQASAQYLQAAGFRSSASHSWSELVQSIRYSSVDLVVLFVRQSTDWQAVYQLLDDLQHNNPQVPMIVWCGQVNFSSDPFGQSVLDLLQELGNCMLLSNASMQELVDQINALLPQANHR
jgi:signal transduction histidine kinase/DNA-binding response OmpR family regulator